ncbi:MAG: AI-2E family transporter [Halorientalis sp.]
MVGLDVDRARAVWWSLAALLGATVAFVLYSFVGTFVFALFIYYATRPAYRRIRRRVRQRTLAAALSLLVFALPAVVLLAYTLAIALQEVPKLDGVDLGPLVTAVEPYIDVSQIVEDPASLLADSAGIETIRSMLSAGLEYAGFIGAGLLHLFVMFAVAFYLLRDGGRLSRWVVQLSDDRGVFDAYLRAVDRSLSNVFFGNILNAILTGAIGAISFSLLNLFAPAGLAIPYPALTGLLTGVGSLIPVIGMKIVYVPVLAYLGFRSVVLGGGYEFVAAFFVVAFVIVDLLPDFVLRPYVSGRQLHVGLVMFAYILGPVLFGWYGIFLGPLLLVLVYHFGRLVLPELVERAPVQPTAVDPGALGPTEAVPSPDDPPTDAGDGAAAEPTGPAQPEADDDE